MHPAHKHLLGHLVFVNSPSPGSLYKSYGKCGLRTNSVSITWWLVGNADSQGTPQTYESKSQHVGPRNLCFNRISIPSLKLDKV